MTWRGTTWRENESRLPGVLDLSRYRTYSCFSQKGFSSSVAIRLFIFPPFLPLSVSLCLCLCLFLSFSLSFSFFSRLPLLILFFQICFIFCNFFYLCVSLTVRTFYGTVWISTRHVTCRTCLAVHPCLWVSFTRTAFQSYPMLVLWNNILLQIWQSVYCNQVSISLCWSVTRNILWAFWSNRSDGVCDFVSPQITGLHCHELCIAYSSVWPSVRLMVHPSKGSSVNQ